MPTAAEIIAMAEEHFDRETLELQIDYCKTVLRAAMVDLSPDDSAARRRRGARLSLAQVNLCNHNLSLLTEALRLQKLLTRETVNRALGQASPYINDPLPRHEGDIYADYFELRLMLRSQPRARRDYEPRARARTPQDGAWTPRENANHRPLRQERQPAPTPQQPDDRLAQAMQQWSVQAEEWLAAGDIGKPVPQLAPEVAQWLEQRAQTSPGYAEWLRAVNTLTQLTERKRSNQREPAGSGGTRATVPA